MFRFALRGEVNTMDKKLYLVVFKITAYKGFRTGEWSDQIRLECDPAHLDSAIRNEKAKLERKVGSIVEPAKARLGRTVGATVAVSQVVPL